MRPVYLRLENFMNHRLSEIDCSTFTSALIVARDKNNDRESNGIGKTTVFSAIEYALFGQVPTSVLEKIIRDGEKKCLVRFEFELGGIPYAVERSRSRSGRSDLTLRRKENDDWVKLSDTRTPEVERALLNLIRLSHKAFTYSIKFGQSDLAGLSTAKKGEERRRMLQEPLELAEYSGLSKIIVEKKRAVGREIDRIETSMQMLGDPVADRTAAEAELQFCDSTIVSKESTIAKLQTNVKELEETLASLRGALNATDSEIHDKIGQLGKRSKELKARIESANERVQESNKIIDTNTKRSSALKNKRQEILDLERDFETNPVRPSAQIKTELDKVTADELTGTKFLARFEAEYDQANKNLPNGNVCPQCLQTISDEHREKCQRETEKLLAQTAEQIARTKANLAKCQSKKNRLHAEHVEAVKREQNQAHFENNKKQIASELELLAKNIQDAEARLAAAVKDMNVATAEEEETLKQIKHLKEQVQGADPNDLNKRIFKVTDERRTFERSIDNVRGELALARQRKGAAIEKLKSIDQSALKLQEMKEELKRQKHVLTVHDLVVDAFSPAGIPHFIIQGMLDELQTETNIWLQKLRPNLELQFDKDVEMTYFVSGKERAYDQLSIGQQVYIALSLKLGLSRVIQRRLGIDIRMLLLDEVDSALDKAGVEAFADAVKILQNDFTVLVITHNDALKDKFSHTILVEGDGDNGATSSVVTSW
jgi:DNA repair exonuclease SbcCD ATPase subunit